MVAAVITRVARGIEATNCSGAEERIAMISEQYRQTVIHEYMAQ